MDSFVLEPHADYNNLRIYPERGRLEKHIGLLCDLVEGLSGEQLLAIGSPFVADECAASYTGGVVRGAAAAATAPFAIYIDSAAIAEDIAAFAPIAAQSYVLCDAAVAAGLPHPYKFPLTESLCSKPRPVDGRVLCVPAERKAAFDAGFHFYFNEKGEFAYDNLVHLCIMVKNGGPLFEQVLTENLGIIDRWTVLDTGSTDGTQDVVRKVLEGKKKGELVEEPFINFRDSRNRCLELAGTRCKYTLMLDDTYAIRGDLRRFLNLIRGDTFANSYSLLIQSDDSEYYSNRLLKTADKLRYLYTIHEVVQAERNVTVVIPKEEAWICDHRAPYMEKRTHARKEYDLKCLYEMLETDPTNPRHLYYLAQTYSCMENYEKAAYWFERRALSPLEGHHQEAVDAMFELGRLYNFKLNKPWPLCEETYKKAYEMDRTRPDALYFIGIHYYLEGVGKEGSEAVANRHIAYAYFKRGFALGYPIHAQFSLKPTLSFHFLPKFLTQLCYEEGDWQTGLAAAERFLEHAKPTDESYGLIGDWHAIFKGLVGMGSNAAVPAIGPKPLLVIVADGGWGPWTGRDLVEKGVGGSETWVIETARWIQREGTYRVVVFCRCAGREEVFEGVEYMDIGGFGSFVAKVAVQTCIVSRYSEYVPVAIAGHVENVYFILHDIGPTGSILPLNHKLKKIFCLTEWHKQFFLANFPQCADRTEVQEYGVDLERFGGGENPGGWGEACTGQRPVQEVPPKQPYSFLYSSFPNRGLLPLLQMWPRIRSIWPEAVLDVYSDIEGEWVNRVANEEMAAIRQLLVGGMEGVRMHGWVSKAELAAAWRQAEVWLYPCTFAETFCLTALEAQAAGVLVVCPPLAALRDTVGDRGVLVGTGMDVAEARTEAWQTAALEALKGVLGEDAETSRRREDWITRGRAWAFARSWEQQTHGLIVMLKSTLRVETGGMYNWTHDLPKGTRVLFENMLNRFVGRGARILEIGTYAGTSLIGMLERLPDATAVAVDRWENYDENNISILRNMEENNVEKLFHRNLEHTGMTGRVIARKGDSADVLLDLVRDEELFDLIYVDGSHKCIDCYTDMALGWRLLRKGGVMAVDDYLYCSDRVMAGELLEFPMKGVDWFLERRKGEYRVLDMGYRVFLEKTVDTVVSPKKASYKVTPFWSPIPEITRAVEMMCEGRGRVLEVGPGSRPFAKATDFVDLGTVAAAVDPSRILRMDIDTETYACADGTYDFVYCRHVLEDIQNPNHAFRQLARVSRAGYIETPSPLIEVLRGADAGGASWRGYVHHRYIVWTDRENILNFLPKYPVLETLTFSEAFERKLADLANGGGMYWNNYYIWDVDKGILPKCKIHKHGITFDIHRDYMNLLQEAIECSLVHTQMLMKRIGIEI